MIYAISPDIVAQAKHCTHNHGCLAGSSVFPLCKVVSPQAGNYVVIEPKFGMILYCAYKTSLEIKTSASTIHGYFCPVRKEIFARYGE
jgi:hypothetical protein